MGAIDNSFVNLKPIMFQHSRDDLRDRNSLLTLCGVNNIIILNVCKQLIKKYILEPFFNEYRITTII